MLDPIGRIWHDLVLVFIAVPVQLRWQVLLQAMELGRDISENKAVLPFFWRLVALVSLRGGRRSTVMFCVELSRWKLGVGCRSG